MASWWLSGLSSSGFDVAVVVVVYVNLSERPAGLMKDVKEEVMWIV